MVLKQVKNKQIPFQDISRLKGFLSKLQQAQSSLRYATLIDAENNYRAYVYRPTKDPLAAEQVKQAWHPWSHESPGFYTSFLQHELALLGIDAIWFDNVADSRSTYDFPGVVSCSEKTLALVECVNIAKSEFRTGVIELKKKYKGLNLTDNQIEENLAFRTGEWTALEHVKKIFNLSGLSRICVKQAYRPIHTITQAGLVRAKYYHKAITPSRPRTVAKQLALFHTRQQKGYVTPDLLNAIEVLGAMSPSQIISERQNSNEVITVNYKVPSVSKDNKYDWPQITGVLPIYLLSAPNTDLDKIVDFSSLDIPYEKRLELKRSREKHKWADEAFLPAFRLYLPAKIS